MVSLYDTDIYSMSQTLASDYETAGYRYSIENGLQSDLVFFFQIHTSARCRQNFVFILCTQHMPPLGWPHTVDTGDHRCMWQ